MLGTCLQNVREKGPLVHNITNYVTVNDVANVILACGASPIMSDEPQDVQDITAICGGLNINIGTLNVLISEIFPRITSNFISCIRLTAVFVLRELAPAPTGSSRTI